MSASGFLGSSWTCTISLPTITRSPIPSAVQESIRMPLCSEPGSFSVTKVCHTGRARARGSTRPAESVTSSTESSGEPSRWARTVIEIR